MDQKVVVITGASSGIGAAIAREAARKGFAVVLAARRTSQLDELAATITQAGGRALVVTTDVTRLDEQRRLVDETIRVFGRLDILVNNAGKPVRGDFGDAPPDTLQDQWNVNVTALVTLTRLALPELRRRRGVVVNIGSTISRFAVPAWGAYAATKIAVASLSTVLRRELQPQGVRVCLVEPGPIRTEFYDHAGSPLGRELGFSAESVARATVRLFDRPRSRIVVPGWLGPPLSIGSAIIWCAPWLLDGIFFLRARLRSKLTHARQAGEHCDGAEPDSSRNDLR